MLTETQARERIRSIENPGERRVNTLLLNFGLQAINFNAQIRDERDREIGEIDALFAFDNHLLIIETTEESEPDSDTIVAWFTKWSNQTNIDRLYQEYNLSPSRSPHRLFFWLSRDRPSPDELSPSLSPILEDSSNKIVFRDEVKRYEENFRIVGKWERNNFLNFLEVENPVSRTPIPAVLFYISDRPAYAFGLSAKDLLEICFISRRYKNEIGFQRAIDESRVQRIQRAIEAGGVLAFPNSILINSDSILLEEKPHRSECPTNVTINLPQNYSSCKVIDGQHRLLGFSKVDSETASSYNLPVVAFEGLNDREEVETFIIINSEQKRVDVNLVLLLKSGIDYQPDSLYYLDRIAVKVVEQLYEDSCLAGRIYMGYADQVRAQTWVTLNTLVRAMKQNRLVRRGGGIFQQNGNDTRTPYLEIRNLFGRMRQNNFPFFMDSDDRFFLTNKGLRILFRFVYLFYRNLEADRISISIEESIRILAETINSDVRVELDGYYGEGGAKRAVDELVSLLRVRSEFGDFESDLRRLRATSAS